MAKRQTGKKGTTQQAGTPTTTGGAAAFTIRRPVRQGGQVFRAGSEQAYLKTNPSEDDLRRAAEAGQIEGDYEAAKVEATRGFRSLPADFPGREDFERGGFRTERQIEDATDDDLLAVDGIGPKTLEEARNYKQQ